MNRGSPASRGARVRHHMSRTRMWELAIGVVTGLVIVLLVLIGSGVLVRPSSSSSSATVTVSEVQWVLLQGSTKEGWGWFGPSYVNVTDQDGLPVNVSSGGHVTVSIILANLDSSNHTVYMVTAAPPFSVVRTTPGLPSPVISGEDDWDLAVTVTAPTVSTDTTYLLVLTVDAVS